MATKPHMRLTLAVCVLLVGCTAPSPQSSDGKPQPTSRAISPPIPTGSPHVCDTTPSVSQRLAEKIRTVVSFQIATNGTVKDVAVMASSGAQVLDDTAVECVKHWTYRPATQDGHPVEVHWEAIVSWTLV